MEEENQSVLTKTWNGIPYWALGAVVILLLRG